MSILTAAELARLKADALATLGETCTIKQRTVTNTGTGPSAVESDRATGVACRRASDRTPQQPVVADANRAQEVIMISLPADQAVFVTDRIIIGADTYEVIRPETTGLQILKRVLCKVV